MELFAILRVLWRRRALVAVGAVASIVLGLTAGRSEPTRSGIAWTSVAVDTRPSQVVVPTPKGADTLGWRALLLGDLMLTDTTTDRLAQAIGVPADELAVIEPTLDIPAAATALPRNATKVTLPAATHVLTVTSNEQIATISLRADAPDRAGAARLAAAAVEVLRAQGSPAERDAQAYSVEASGSIASEAVVKGGGRRTMAGLTLLAFAFWCGGTVLLPRRRDTTGSGRMAPAPRTA